MVNLATEGRECLLHLNRCDVGPAVEKTAAFAQKLAAPDEICLDQVNGDAALRRPERP